MRHCSIPEGSWAWTVPGTLIHSIRLTTPGVRGRDINTREEVSIAPCGEIEYTLAAAATIAGSLVPAGTRVEDRLPIDYDSRQDDTAYRRECDALGPILLEAIRQGAEIDGLTPVWAVRALKYAPEDGREKILRAWDAEDWKFSRVIRETYPRFSEAAWEEAERRLGLRS